MSAAEPYYEIRTQAEWSTKDGAEALARMINSYWRERGYDVCAHVEKRCYDKSRAAFVFGVRSLLRNGLPQKANKHA